MTLKEIQNKLLLWEATENPLAPLTSGQREAILDLESIILGVSPDTEEVCINIYILFITCVLQYLYPFKDRTIYSL